MAAAIANAQTAGSPDSARISTDTYTSEGTACDKGKATMSSQGVKVGKPPGKISPRGTGDKQRPFPNFRGLLKRGKPEEAARVANPDDPARKDLSAVTDPCDDFIGTTNVSEVWFAGCHCGEFDSHLSSLRRS